MALWIPITIAAAFLQNARSAVQKHLKGVIGQDGAVFVRFGYGAPFAALYAAALHLLLEPLPAATGAWGGYLIVGAGFQVAGTYALLASFDGAGFGLGTAYSKTEPILAAVFSAVILGELLALGAAIGVVIGVAGVLIVSLGTGVPWRAALLSRGAALGVLSAAFFGISAVGYRAAALSLEDGGFLVRAAMTLAAATLLQAGGMALYLAWRRPGELTRVRRAWRPGLAAGFAGAAASGCWFTAMTLEPVAHVRALGQVELVFTFAASLLIFGERPAAREYLGVALIIFGVLILLLAV